MLLTSPQTPKPRPRVSTSHPTGFARSREAINEPTPIQSNETAPPIPTKYQNPGPPDRGSHATVATMTTRRCPEHERAATEHGVAHPVPPIGRGVIDLPGTIRPWRGS